MNVISPPDEIARRHFRTSSLATHKLMNLSSCSHSCSAIIISRSTPAGIARTSTNPPFESAVNNPITRVVSSGSSNGLKLTRKWQSTKFPSNVVKVQYILTTAIDSGDGRSEKRYVRNSLYSRMNPPPRTSHLLE